MSSWLGGWGIVAGWLKVKSLLTADNNLVLTGEFQDSRHLIGGGENGNITASQYLKTYDGIPYSANTGYRAFRAGSIIGLACNFNVSAVTTPGTVSINAYVNGSSKWGWSSANINAPGVYGMQRTQARHTDNFTIGQNIALYFSFGSFVGTIDDIVAYMCVQFDS